MYKTAIKRKRPVTRHYIRHHHKSDLDKIKAFLLETSQGWQHAAGDRLNQSLEGVKEKSMKVNKYISKKPFKSVGVTLVSGLLAGFCIGYFINK